jgi:protein dithiol oxidoreductase (disulfide-forming)
MLIRRTILALVFLVVCAPGRGDVVAGRDYQALRSVQRSDSPGKIEVIEYFSYGCPHCYDLHPLITQWSRNLAKDVVFRRVAISIGHRSWANLAQATYALESSGDLARLDDALFDALHKEHLPLTDEKSIGEWVGRHGVDAAKFAAAYKSFSVVNKVAQAEGVARADRINALPTVVVAGKFAVLGHTHQDTLRIADELIAKARAELAPR